MMEIIRIFKNFVVPVFILKLILFLIGKRSHIDKLFGTLEINITKSKNQSLVGSHPIPADRK